MPATIEKKNVATATNPKKEEKKPITKNSDTNSPDTTAKDTPKKGVSEKPEKAKTEKPRAEEPKAEKAMNPPAIDKKALKEVKVFNDNIRKELNSVESSFIRIGYCLAMIKTNKYYELAGHKNIYDYAKTEFGIARGTCSDFINVVERFCIKDEAGNPVPKINEDYKDFKSSQLIPLLGTTDDKEIKEKGISPDMTVREIKKKVKGTSEADAEQKSSNARTETEKDTVIDVESKEIIRNVVITVNDIAEYRKKIDDIDDLITNCLKKGKKIEICMVEN